MPEPDAPDPVAELITSLAGTGYIADRELALVLHLAETLELPVLLEGEPGVGKTAVAEALATAKGARLVRLQCYEGLGAQHALYEWDYARQLLEIRMAEARGSVGDELRSAVFSPEFLLRRPLLEAIDPPDDRPVVLLVDEVDRADQEFEALLLEVLGQFQVTVPELGTIVATKKPRVVLTANRTRALSDALRRRCLYHWLPYPTVDREVRIVEARVPEASTELVQRACALVAQMRDRAYRKTPGISETVDWVRALTAMGGRLDADSLRDCAGCLVKDADDLTRFRRGEGADLLRVVGTG
ncbi:AAA domain (dynein-related subfamily) [Pseudonocardia thermophila]|uniref:AAA domain (Dynein-related subfamily) n=1 Tax=Pseudonocardia thermophila TaxID=1848 RepID=A0A1M6SFJ9_PSETH|nr:MoxR family ATPase [Pseudonocardia thermophila]SHK43476.1 AAA domain (dynein-related subfamily) [Pseudonocardia thermophila]